MPANLPPQYYEAKRRYEKARTNAEKIAVLEEMLAIMPKHKGTDHLRAELRTRIAKLRREKPESRRRGGGGKNYHVRRQGAAQIPLIGAPNSGKSSLLVALTNAESTVAPYPFTTQDIVVGMAPFENIKFQLIDLPPITADYMKPWMNDPIRNADLIAFVIDLSTDSVLEDADGVIRKLHEYDIELVSEPPEEEEDINFDRIFKRTFMLANKIDAPGASDRLEIMSEFFGETYEIIPVSAKTGEKLEELKKRMFELANIIRVYTKPPGKKHDPSNPIVFPKGSTIVDVAEEIHKDFVEHLRFARLWRSDKIQGMSVARDEILEDGDIVEFHV